MKATPTDFIDALIDDLDPVTPAPSWSQSSLLTSGSAWLVVAALVLATGPLRAGAIEALGSSPLYALEFGIGVLTGIASLAAGIEWGVPGRPHGLRVAAPAVVLASIWTGLTIYAATTSPGPPEMLGKRVHCSLEIMTFSVPPLALALFVIDRRALFSRATTGLFVGIGAAAIPAVWMQLACMHGALHTLTHHLAPITLIAVLGAVASAWLVPRPAGRRSRRR